MDCQKKYYYQSTIWRLGVHKNFNQLWFATLLFTTKTYTLFISLLNLSRACKNSFRVLDVFVPIMLSLITALICQMSISLVFTGTFWCLYLSLSVSPPFSLPFLLSFCFSFSKNWKVCACKQWFWYYVAMWWGKTCLGTEQISWGHGLFALANVFGPSSIWTDLHLTKPMFEAIANIGCVWFNNWP